MSYQKELDEYTDEQLQEEIQRRISLNAIGCCTYCNRLGSTESCKQIEQHKKAKDKLDLITQAEAAPQPVYTTFPHICKSTTTNGACGVCGKPLVTF